MEKSLGGAAKARERKKLKLEQVAHNCSQNISSMFNAITKKSSKLEPVEPQGSKFTQPSPNSQLQPDEDHQEYLVDDPNPDKAEEELISAQVELHSNISNSIHIPILHEKEKQDNVVDNIVSKSLICTRTILCNH
uniref:Uncharacterized protein n=1 Tax=Schizaphis graminum TaxID=13262 RepID=A0A2S2NDP8_SCHGA